MSLFRGYYSHSFSYTFADDFNIPTHLLIIFYGKWECVIAELACDRSRSGEVSRQYNIMIAYLCILFEI